MPKTTNEIINFGFVTEETTTEGYKKDFHKFMNKRWWSEEEIKKALIDCSDIKGKCDIMYLYDLLFGNEE